jgi:hypothetical protein
LEWGKKFTVEEDKLSAREAHEEIRRIIVIIRISIESPT